jgi:8-oxo-dGTP pyrophosphatase MutT (NUDIX family)
LATTWLPRAEFVQTLPRAVHGCGVLLFDADERLLLLYDAFHEARAADGWPQRWWFPGGLLDDGETPLQGALRETQEETGLTLDGPQRPLGVEFVPPRHGWPAVTNYFFSGGILSSQHIDAIRLSDEHEEHQFRHPDDWAPSLGKTSYTRLGALVHAHHSGIPVVLHRGEPM